MQHVKMNDPKCFSYLTCWIFSLIHAITELRKRQLKSKILHAINTILEFIFSQVLS